jgi:hypothetical protein
MNENPSQEEITEQVQKPLEARSRKALEVTGETERLDFV